MVLLVLFAFLAGLVTILAPCIWPLLPIILSSSATQGKRKPLGITLGVVISFTIFTLAISYLIKVLPFDTNILRYIAAVIIGFLGLTLVIPALNDYVEAKVSYFSSLLPLKNNTSSQGFFSGFVTGLALGIVWTPCAGPILATIAALASTLKVNIEVILVTVSYSIGTGIPLFIFATVGSRIFQKNKGIQNNLVRIQRVFGIIVILIAIGIIFNIDQEVEADLLNFLPSYTQALNNLTTNNGVTNELTNLSGHPVSGLPILSKAPDFTGITTWLNTPSPIHISDLKGKVVLVDFWTYTCINCIRSLPHTIAWYQEYKADGFIVIGIHTPEFQFEHNTANVQNALKQYGITYPVGQDNNYDTWNAYNNEYWPAEYLIDAKGNIRYTSFGEGDYSQTESNIRSLLEEAGKKVQPTMTNVPDKTPTQQVTPETYLGSERIDTLTPSETIIGGKQTFPNAENPASNDYAYQGTWDIEQEYSAASQNASITLNFYANEVYLVLSPATSNDTVSVLLDGKAITANDEGSDVSNGKVQVTSQRLYNLVNLHGDYAQHTLQLLFNTKGTQAYDFTFG